MTIVSNTLSEQETLQQLAGRGLRITQARRAIVHILLGENGYLEPQRVAELARRQGQPVGLVTVYRTLELLAQLGLVRRIHAEDGCHAYAAIGEGHRHHIICERCGGVADFEGCDLSELLHRVERETGYSVSEHMLELLGMCPECQRRAL